MTIFLAYAPVGKNHNAFKPKKNNNKKKGRRGKDEPELLNPSVYPMLVFSSDVDPETIVSRMTHEFCHAGGFYFRKKQLQCMETVTPFIIFYLYTFNNIATLHAELMDLLKKDPRGTGKQFYAPRGVPVFDDPRNQHSPRGAKASGPARISVLRLLAGDAGGTTSTPD
jgi:hypothetical protein